MNESIQAIRVPKRTGTHADVFEVVGLADLLSQVMPQGKPVLVVEAGPYFEVQLPVPLTNDALAAIPQDAGYPHLKVNGKAVGVTGSIDYQAEKAKVERWSKAAKLKREARGSVPPDIEEALQRDKPLDSWRQLQVLNTLQGDETANKVYVIILERDPPEFSVEVAEAIRNVAQSKESGLDWKVSTVQLFAPVAAKGYARLKPDGTDRNDKTKEQWADAFWEWMKYRGYFRVASPYFQGERGEHIRLLCPVPGNISVRAMMGITSELRKRPLYANTSSKLDSLAVLELARLLIAHSLEYHQQGEPFFDDLSIKDHTPAELVSGVMITHYQSLGQARAVSGMSTLALPDWFKIDNAEHAMLWLATLEEHRQVVRGLQDDHSDEIGLLLAYRRFLEQRKDEALWALVEFMERYGAFVVRANGSLVSGRRRWVTRFTDTYFKEVLMASDGDLTKIIEDPGFEAVARAVRQSTVTAQNARVRERQGGKEAWREVRYELLHDIHRTRKVPGNDFIQCVGEFVSHYNYENARRREQKNDLRAAPANVSDEEMKSFIALVDKFGAATVGALLAAYGSCKEKWDEDESAKRDAPDAEAVTKD